MFWNKKETIIKIFSEEYLELKGLIKKLQLEISSLELDLQLYIRKLKVTKGLSKGNEGVLDETENYFKDVIVKS